MRQNIPEAKTSKASGISKSDKDTAKKNPSNSDSSSNSSNSTPKVLVIGLDGGCLDLLLPWIREGRLKNLASLLNQGAWGDLRTILPPLTASAWSSLYTGKNPGKHGVLEFVGLREDRKSAYLVNSTHRDAEDVWEIIGRHGKRVGVINAPITYPVRRINGFMVTGFLTPQGVRDYTYPVELGDEIGRLQPGFKPGRMKSKVYLGKDRLLEYALRGVEEKGRLALYLMDRYESDFLIFVIDETDLVQHRFWRVSANLRERVGERDADAILRVYEKVDEVIGQLLERSRDAHVFVVSDHGGAPVDKFLHVNYFLHKMGLLRFKSSGRTLLKKILHRVGLNPLRILRLSRSIRLGLLGAVVVRRLAFLWPDIDWEATSAYAVGSGIYLKRNRNDGWAGLEPDESYYRVRQTIIDSLNELRDPENGEKVVDKVYLKSDIYRGPHADKGSDIRLTTRKGYYPFAFGPVINSVLTENYGAVSGGHSLDGILIIKGRGVSSGRIDAASITDVAPTILYCMGIPVPSDMDGKVLLTAFNDSYMKSNPIIYSEPKGEEHRERYVFSAEEKKELESRLRDLGYIG